METISRNSPMAQVELVKSGVSSCIVVNGTRVTNGKLYGFGHTVACCHINKDRLRKLIEGKETVQIYAVNNGWKGIWVEGVNISRKGKKSDYDEHLKRVERGIRAEYTPRMKKLTYSQGKLLIKLVYRECDSSSYQLVQAFLGPIRAGFYQAFAALFGASLMKKYDPNGVDRYTERIVRQVEAGQI